MASLTLLMSTNNLKKHFFWNTVGQTNTLKPTENTFFYSCRKLWFSLAILIWVSIDFIIASNLIKILSFSDLKLSIFECARFNGGSSWAHFSPKLFTMIRANTTKYSGWPKWNMPKSGTFFKISQNSDRKGF